MKELLEYIILVALSWSVIMIIILIREFDKLNVKFAKLGKQER